MNTWARGKLPNDGGYRKIYIHSLASPHLPKVPIFPPPESPSHLSTLQAFWVLFSPCQGEMAKSLMLKPIHCIMLLKTWSNVYTLLYIK